MNVTNKELKAIKQLLTNNDIKNISKKTKMSDSTVNAVFYTRPNHIIEQEIILTGKKKLIEFQYLIQKIEAKNQIEKDLSEEEYNRIKSLPTWKAGHDYYLMIDCYLQMSHLKFENIEAIIDQIKIEFKELFYYQYRVIDIVNRLTGTSIKEIIKSFDK